MLALGLAQLHERVKCGEATSKGGPVQQAYGGVGAKWPTRWWCVGGASSNARRAETASRGSESVGAVMQAAGVGKRTASHKKWGA
jgi:hypothetical protein